MIVKMTRDDNDNLAIAIAKAFKKSRSTLAQDIQR